MDNIKKAYLVGSAVTCPHCNKTHGGVTEAYINAVVECDGCGYDFTIKKGLRIVKNPLNHQLRPPNRGMMPQRRLHG